MATQADIAAQLRAQNASLKAISDGIDKVGTETDQVLKEVQDLKDVIANQDVVSPELQSAVDDVAAAVDSLKTHVTAVDDKVPDVIPAPVP